MHSEMWATCHSCPSLGLEPHAEGQNPSTQVAHPRLIRGPVKNRGRGWAGLLHPWKAVDGTEDTAVLQDGQTGRQTAAMSRKLAELDPSFPSFRGYPSELLPSSKFLMGNEATWGSIGHVRRSAGPSAKSPACPPVFHLQESWSRGAPTLSEASSCPGWEGERQSSSVLARNSNKQPRLCTGSFLLGVVKGL